MSGPGRFASGLFSESHVAEDDDDGMDLRMMDFYKIASGVQLVKMGHRGWGDWKILADRLPGGSAQKGS